MALLYDGGGHAPVRRRDSGRQPAWSGPYLAGVLSAILGGLVVVAAAVGKLFKFHDNWLHYRGLVEALGRERGFLGSRRRLRVAARRSRPQTTLVERVENLLASATSRFIENTPQRARRCSSR